MLALGSLGSGIAYVAYYNVLKAAGSAIASTITFITPVVAVLLGVLVRGESVHWYEPIGGALWPLLLDVVGVPLPQPEGRFSRFPSEIAVCVFHSMRQAEGALRA